MRQLRRTLFVVLGVAAGWPFSVNGQSTEFNTVMMDATFKIVGPSAREPGKYKCGTGFIVGLPVPGSAERSFYVAVTALHVFSEMAGDIVHLIGRVKDSEGLTVRSPLQLRIRQDGVPLYVKHPAADVAAMYISLPSNTALRMTTTKALATSQIFTRLEIHPGDEMLTFGYPYCFEADGRGFPILRKGVVASPTQPAEALNAFFLDLPAFGGNSGGPVYFSYVGRLYGGQIHLTESHNYIAGILTQTAIAASGESLGVANVVPAQFIEETIKLLPARPIP